MRFLITRPKPDAEKLAAMLVAKGHQSLISPVMKVVFHKTVPPAANTISGLVITSKNALRGLEDGHEMPCFKNLPLFAVGKSSANAARQRHFSRVFEAQGRADGLAALINQHLDAKNCAPLYHPSGKHKAFDLVPPFNDLGFELIEQTVYETSEATQLTAPVIKALNNSTIDAVILLSPRSARLFAKLIKTHRLEHCLCRISCVCLSQKVANAADELSWLEKRVAAHPDIDHLIDLIDQMT